MLETEAETNARHLRRAYLIIIIVCITISIITIVHLWERYAPLPQLGECEEAGYAGGQMVNDEILCYDDCTSNQLTGCKKIGVVGGRL